MSADALSTYATCWLVTRKDGTVFAFTDHDHDLTIGGVTYKAALSYSASAIRTQSDLAVDNLEVVGVLDSSEITDSDLRAGLFNNAAVQISTVDWSSLTVVKKNRAGWIGQVVLAKNSYQAELRGLMQALQTKLGIVTSPKCRVDLGDGNCQVPLGPLTLSDVTVNATAKTFTTASGNFSAYVVGQTLAISGASAGNNGNFVISAVSQSTLTFATASGLVNEVAGAAITFSLTQSGSVSAVTSLREFAPSGILGGAVRNVSITETTIQFNAPNVIEDQSMGIWDAGFKIGDQIRISGSGDNDTLHTIANITNGGGWSYIAVEGGIVNEPGGEPVTIATVNPDYFAWGLVTWLTGENAGLTMEVKSWDGTNLSLFLPMPNPIQVGDTFTVTPGCDFRWPTCVSKFANGINFRGEPYMSGQDAALNYPNAT